MKRHRICTVIGLVTILLLLSGCNKSSQEPIPVQSQEPESSSVVQVFTCSGTWEITGVKQNDIALNLNEVLEEMGGNIVLTLHKDGSMYGRIQNSAMDGTWTQNGKKITIFMSNGKELNLISDEETLVMEQDKRKYIFTKMED